MESAGRYGADFTNPYFQPCLSCPWRWNHGIRKSGRQHPPLYIPDAGTGIRTGKNTSGCSG